ncbi:GNAT family N-acetyltransferase [Streptomyces sp. G45]|uniref:GNAT family N-acetyltransferase n=1 Tax=Streptomyces sp. G45 TaxID=3406627 RepID=UPI003C2649CF
MVPFTAGHAHAVAGWARTAEEAVLWCGVREHPVPAATVASWQRDDDVRARLLLCGEHPVGYGELWRDEHEGEIELARIVVAPHARGRGLGRALVRALLTEALGTGCDQVFLRVHPDNAAALGCYRSVGFTPVPAADAAAWNTRQPVAYVWLRWPVGSTAAHG